ncbi:MAG: DNA starvation/stationary phase protection protein [Bacteroidota bacterium]|nr:DNA starvation/stationary phase protection protein [Bacteroidota bacterium]MDP3144032.1 DNA starvation/stationary phase protection protein [Bacteroidota bacterium]
MKLNIGISEKHLKNTSSILSTVLANEMTLYVKTRKAHWNVAGESFMELHKLFQDHYQQLEESIDEVAERIGKLGHKTIGTMAEFSKLTMIKEHPGKYSSSKEILKELLKDHETIIVELRTDITNCSDKNNDAGTADYLTGLMEQHETIAWVLRRYLN